MLAKKAACVWPNRSKKPPKKPNGCWGRTLVTHQTGPAGKQVNRIYIEDGSGIESELYLALLVDRQSSRVSFVCSTEGGMDIEEVAASTPEKKSCRSALIPPPVIRRSMVVASLLPWPHRSAGQAMRFADGHTL